MPKCLTRITQEEYNEYYPYDGMEGSYYSVFVETDLNKASTIEGQRLSSDDAIAGYIASMLLLETDPVFFISYDGVYTTGGTDYYEFRCHRSIKTNRSRRKKDVSHKLMSCLLYTSRCV